MKLALFFAFTLFVVAGLLAGLQRAVVLALIAGGLALWLLPTVVHALG